MFLRVVLLLMLTSTLTTPAFSQQRDKKAGKSSKSQPVLTKEEEQLRLSAVSLLHSVAQSVNEIDDVTERVRVLAEVGDAFWAVDPEQARTVLTRAFKEIEKLALSSGTDAQWLAVQKRTLRRVVLSRIARREPSLASQLVHDLPDEITTADEKVMQRQGVPTPNAEALLGIAEGLLATDPQRAAATAAHSLPDGLSQRLRQFLIRLRAKDSAAADALVAAAIREASIQRPGRLFDVMVLWDYVYQPQDFYFNGVVWDRQKDEPRQNASRDLRRLVLAFAVNAVVENLQQLTGGPQPAEDRSVAQLHLTSLHSVIQQLLPAMQADWPRGTVDLQQALVRVEQELRTNGQNIPNRPPLTDTESNTTVVDGLLERAGAAPQGELRDSLYAAASLKLLELRQYERARDVAAKIDDEERRSTLLEPLNFNYAASLLETDRLPEALSVANQLKTPELRIGSLARIGRAFTEKGDSQTALQVLNNAQSIVNKTEPKVEVAAAALRLASAFSKVDPIRVSELITSAVQIVNKIKPAEPPWILTAPAGVDDRLGISWRNGENGGLQSVRAAYPRNGGLMELLSKVDFNQAVSLSKTVNSKAFSLALQAALCRAAIEALEAKSSSLKSD